MASAHDLIPHGRPWLLVDRVRSATATRVEAEKRVTADDPLVAGELPELLVVEALAQASACLNADDLGAHRGYLVAARGFTFDGRARPGDTLVLVAEQEAHLGALRRLQTTATVDGQVIARGLLTFAVEKA
jgi:3-hydroxymyristoyl/3-hydroxydecanoyl-(acyl carrier protein) dehydratase